MSDLINNPAPSPVPTNSPELAELKANCASLESQTHTLRLVLLLVVGALCIFFWREAGFNGALAAQMQPQIAQISQFATQLEKQGSSVEKQMQALQAAAMRLAEYGKTHADYAQILAKYGLVVAAAPAPTTASVPRPATAPVKK